MKTASVTALETGDIRIGKAVFERKTPPDFASTVIEDGRDIYGQCEAMQERVEDHEDDIESAYLLVEGDMTDFDSLTHTRVRSGALRGVVSSLMERTGVPVVFCSNHALLADVAVRIGRKTQEAPSSTMRFNPAGRIERDDAPTTMKFYVGLPDVSETLAERLYDHFPTVESLLNATPSDIREVDGFGEKRAESIYQSLRTDD